MTYLGILLIGLVAGIFGGFFGIGGGIIIVPALFYLFKYSQHLSQGTTLAAMIPPIGLLAAMKYYQTGNVNIKAAAIIACAFFFGGWIGGWLAQSVSDVMLRRCFGFVLLLIAVKMLIGK